MLSLCKATVHLVSWHSILDPHMNRESSQESRLDSQLLRLDSLWVRLYSRCLCLNSRTRFLWDSPNRNGFCLSFCKTPVKTWRKEENVDGSVFMSHEGLWLWPSVETQSARNLFPGFSVEPITCNTCHKCHM